MSTVDSIVGTIRVLNVSETQQVFRIVELQLARLIQLESAAAEVAEVQHRYLTARDGTPPGLTGDRAEPSDWPDFIQHTGAHDAYPGGYVIHAEGRLYRAKRNGVTHTPKDAPIEWEGVTYTLLPETEPEPEEWPTWVPWDNIGPLYQEGAKVTHKDRKWFATVGNNHWEPSVYGWTEADANSKVR